MRRMATYGGLESLPAGEIYCYVDGEIDECCMIQ